MRKNFLGDYKVDYRITGITSYIEKLYGWQKVDYKITGITSFAYKTFWSIVRSITELRQLHALMKTFLAIIRSITELQKLQALLKNFLADKKVDYKITGITSFA